MVTPCRSAASGLGVARPPDRLSLRREVLIGEWRCGRRLVDAEGVSGRRVAGIASLGEAFIGLIELALIAELDRAVAERKGLRHGGVGHVRHREALAGKNRLRDRA